MPSSGRGPDVPSGTGPAFPIFWDVPPPSGVLRGLLNYWDKRRGQRPMPARADIDPLDIPIFLPKVMLIDVLRDPLDFRYRLIGTGVVERVQADHTGMRFSEIPHLAKPSISFAFACAIVESGRPGWANIPYVGQDRVTRLASAVAMPLSADGVTVNMLIYGVDFIARGALADSAKRVS